MADALEIAKKLKRKPPAFLMDMMTAKGYYEVPDRKKLTTIGNIICESMPE